MRLNIRSVASAVLCVSVILPINGRADVNETANIDNVVAQAIRPVMERYNVPGMAVGIVMKGQYHVYYYGVASRATAAPVESGTLFEVGSVSKTFTATLAAYAQIRGALSMSDMTSNHIPSLRGSSFD